MEALGIASPKTMVLLAVMQQNSGGEEDTYGQPQTSEAKR